MIEKLGELLTRDAYLLVVDVEKERFICTVGTGAPVDGAHGPRFGDMNSTAKALLSSLSTNDTPPNDVSFTVQAEDADKRTSWSLQPMYGLKRNSLENGTDRSCSTHRCVSDIRMTKNGVSNTLDDLIIASISPTHPKRTLHSLGPVLDASGWHVTYKPFPFPKPTKRTVILILDELWEPLLSKVNHEQWEAIKTLISWQMPLFWVTEGAQGMVTRPDNAMVHGLFRVARREDPDAKLVTLDVHSNTSPATERAIEKVLGLLKRDGPVETEYYVECGGTLCIPRVMPDDSMSRFRRGEDEGFEPIIQGFHSNPVQVQLRAERLGTLEALEWYETEIKEIKEIFPNNIEVEVMAVGVNFKDVAIVMGIIPDDEYNLGVECAGVVRRLGPGANEKFKIGDRVCMLNFGTYGNRVRVSVDRCHIIPDAMTFEEAATIPSVYLCSLYAMYHLGGLRQGQVSLVYLFHGRDKADGSLSHEL